MFFYVYPRQKLMNTSEKNITKKNTHFNYFLNTNVVTNI